MSRWFRFYDDAVNDPKVQRLAGDKFKAWVNLLCLASKNDGVLPQLADISFALRLSEDKVSSLLNEFCEKGLIDPVEVDGAPMSYAPHNWDVRQFKSDKTDPTAASRQKAYRDRNKSRDGDRNATVTVTPPRTETEQIQSRTDSHSAKPSGVREAFQRFKAAYPRREGSNPWQPAEKKFTALVKSGVDPEQIIAGAKKLAAEEAARGNVGSKFIPQAITWLNQQRYADAATSETLDETAAGYHAKFGSAQLDAWDEYAFRTTGKRLPRDRAGGWRCKSEWPPGHDPQFSLKTITEENAA